MRRRAETGALSGCGRSRGGIHDCSPMASFMAAISCNWLTMISWAIAPQLLVLAVAQFDHGHVDRGP